MRLVFFTLMQRIIQPEWVIEKLEALFAGLPCSDPPSSRRRCSRWFQRSKAEDGRQMGKSGVQRLKSLVGSRELVALRLRRLLNLRQIELQTRQYQRG